jgi:hypothetical protein
VSRTQQNAKPSPKPPISYIRKAIVNLSRVYTSLLVL